MQKRKLTSRPFGLALAIVFLLVSLPCLSQSSKPTLVADKEIGIFAAPRNGLFCQRGKKIGSLRRGAEVSNYREVRTYCGLFFEYPYLEITYTTSDGETLSGYVHRTDDDGSDRFHMKAQ